MKIWGAGTARSLRPIWTAEELGLVYDLIPIGPRTGETRTSEYTAMNPAQKIPLLEDKGMLLSESVAICRYLIENYASDNLMPPQNTRHRAMEDQWCCYIYGEIDETSLYVMRRHQDLSEIYGTSPTVVSAAQSYAELHLGVVARKLGEKDFLMGEEFSLPDLLLMTCLDWAVNYGVTVPASLLEYHQRIAQRPAYDRAMTINCTKRLMEK